VARPRFNSSTHEQQRQRQRQQHQHQQHQQESSTQSYELFASMFRIESLLGQGGMGCVYAAHDLHLDRPVAIKVLHARYARDGQMAARFLREGRVMATLSSVHTTRVHMVGRDENGSPYIVMERAEGSDLGAIVEERSQLPWTEAVEYLRQMCIAIGEAHALGIIHRDIKPANVIVGESSVDGSPLVKVLDFGVAKEERSSSASAASSEGSGLTSVRSVLGTPEYMSPEQFRATRDVDHRADIWSLGATLYFMIAGRPPFEAETLSALMAVIQHGDTPSVLDAADLVPPQLDAVIRRCLHRDPEGRFATVADLSAALLAATHPETSPRYHDRGSDPTAMMAHHPVFESERSDDTQQMLPETLVDRTVAMPYPTNTNTNNNSNSNTNNTNTSNSASIRTSLASIPPPSSGLPAEHTMISSSAPISTAPLAVTPPPRVPWHVVMIALAVGVIIGGGVVAVVLLVVVARVR
jgi:serine/threonine protein kinase